MTTAAARRSDRSPISSQSTTKKEIERSSTPASRVMLKAPLEDEPGTAAHQAQTAEVIDKVELLEADLTAYLSRLATEGDELCVRVKDGPAGPSREVTRLAELHRLLLEKRIWGAQVHHRVDGMSVVDTLMVHQGGTRRTRSRGS